MQMTVFSIDRCCCLRHEFSATGAEAIIDGSKMLQKIDLLIDQSNMVCESPGRNAGRDIATQIS